MEAGAEAATEAATEAGAEAGAEAEAGGGAEAGAWLQGPRMRHAQLQASGAARLSSVDGHESTVGDAQADLTILHLSWESGCSESSRLHATPGKD